MTIQIASRRQYSRSLFEVNEVFGK